MPVVLTTLLLFLCACASTPVTAEHSEAGSPSGQPTAGDATLGGKSASTPERENDRLAILDMEDTTDDIDEESLEQASEYFRILIVQSGRFTVVSNEEKRALIRELRKESHGMQYDESQRVPLGKRVAANMVLISTILKIEDRYILKAEMIDLAKETIVTGASETFSPETFQQAIEAVARAITGGSGTPGEQPSPPVIAEETAPTPEAEGTPAAATPTDRHDDEGQSINLTIITFVSAREGREPDPFYRQAAEKQRERKKHEQQTDNQKAATDTNSEGKGEAAPPIKKPIRFTAPIRKPIWFRAVQRARTSPVLVVPDSTTPSRSLQPTEKRGDTTNLRTLPETRHLPSAEQPPRDRKDPWIQHPPPSSPRRNPPPVPAPHPAVTPAKTSPAPAVTPSSPTKSKKKEKKKEEEEEEEEEKKEEEKKKKQPSPNPVITPRR